ncbi:hypothetical protein CES86_3769 [Brucella lupini]|uniref:Uncharacterized protein n=1 Tax=Brucella lupini TaxID=255457 RepID=A0A256GI71_9HYPH|nr:hypothetical protein CES86_3769 [Brucella lupini]
MERATTINQTPFPRSRTRPKVASQDPAEVAPFSICYEVTGTGLAANDRSTPFQLHHFSGSP